MAKDGTLKRWFTRPGSSAERAALDQRTRIAQQQQQWTEVDRLRAQGFQKEADALQRQLQPFQNALLRSLGLPLGGGGGAGGGRFGFGPPGGAGGGQLSPEDYAAFEKMWSVPAAEWFNPRTEPGLQEQINPFLDIPGKTQEFYNARLGSSTQMLADQMAAARNEYNANLGERGMTGASFAPGGRANLAILGSQQGMRNLSDAIAARESMRSGLQEEQREGATTWSDMLRRSIIDKITAEAAERGQTIQSVLTRYGLLGADLGRLTSLGDVSGSIGNLGSVGTAYGNIAAGWGEYGKQAMAPLYSLANAAATYYSGGRAGGLIKQEAPGPYNPAPTWNPQAPPTPQQNPWAGGGFRNPFEINQGTPRQTRYQPYGGWGY